MRTLPGAALWLCVILHSILVVGGDSRARTGALSDKAFQVLPGPRTRSGVSWTTAPRRQQGSCRRVRVASCPGRKRTHLHGCNGYAKSASNALTGAAIFGLFVQAGDFRGHACGGPNTGQGPN